MSDPVERINPETTAPDEVLRAKLEELLPGSIVEGNLDAQRLADLLNVQIDGLVERPERFGLNWAGKKSAIKALRTPSRASLAPDMDNSINWDTAENVFIEGDNLEVLKLLQKSYNDKVKLIYIDPPYNTGKDFVYNDDFSDPVKHYLEVTGQIDAEGNRLVANTEVTGRKHSNWLNMMYSRLSLARNLLSDDGLIFVSISDVEFANVYSLMCEIFGEENFIENFFWESTFRPSNLSNTVRRNAEYLICFARQLNPSLHMVERKQEPQGEASLTQNNNQKRDLSFPRHSVSFGIPDGTYKPQVIGNIEVKTIIEVKNGFNENDFILNGKFKWSQDYLNDEIEKSVTLLIKSDSLIPYYRKDYQLTELTPTKIIPNDVVGDVLAANAEIKSLLGEALFPYPKPTSLITFCMRISGVKTNDLVMDFFAGSGTTGHAVALYNKEHGVQVKYVLVNINEETAESSEARKLGYATVSEITRLRLQKVQELFEANRDKGLRCFRIDKSNFLEKVESDSNHELVLFKETLDSSANDNEIVSEVLLNTGVTLDQPWIRKSLCKTPVVISGGVAVALARRVNDDLVQELLKEDVHLVVFLEDGFQNADDVKANAHFAFKRSNKTMKTM